MEGNANLFYGKDDLSNKQSLLKCSQGWCLMFADAVDLTGLAHPVFCSLLPFPHCCLSLSPLLLPSLLLLCGLCLLQEAQVVTVTGQAHAPLAFTPTAGPGDTRVPQRSCHCPGY